VLQMFTDGGAAVAVGDFDNDGRDDLFVVDSDTGKPHHLMKNLGTGDDGVPRFADVAAAAGVSGGNDLLSICSDALWLDFDNDGWRDLLVARFGTPILYRNLGPDESGTIRFEDVSVAAGLTAFGNTIAAITFDFDRDGFLDLMLGNYFQPKNLLDLDTPHVLPNNLDYADNGGGVSFWHNVAAGGGRRFVEITAEAGLAHHTGWTLDLGHADLDNDGWQDVYVAGDYGTDRLFMNREGEGGRVFADLTEEAMGLDTKQGMNVDFGDYDRDGFLDVYVTNITDEYMKECNFLWHNNGDGTLIDLARETGTCDTDWGWAAKFGDFDNDGWEDLFAVDGLRSRGKQNYIPLLLEVIITPGIDFSDVDSYPDIGDMTWSGYQKQRLFHNLGDGTFKEIGAAAGVDNDLDGRGIGMADFDDDGRLDLYQTNANQPALLYMNRTEGAGNWVELELTGTRSNRDAIGARVRLVARVGDRLETWIREVNGGNAYSSQSTKRLHFGLGAATAVESLEIRWPGGEVGKLVAEDGRPPIAVNAITRIVEGEGVAR
jgi:ASPIC and UnbV/FG-GAP-like repeat